MRTTTIMLLSGLAVAIASTPSQAQTSSGAHRDVMNTIATYQTKDPGLKKFFDNAVGYAVFPAIGEGAVGVGGAHGDGELIVGGQAIGKISMTQITVGLQLGGQSYSEIIFFETQRAVDGFEHGDFAFAAEATAVALASGASANAAYRNGVAVFTATNGGLMYQASIGGQKFSFKAY
jgi:lipid-binding SYLF domain-containing protein